ncbi:transposase [Azotobacter beijerinckii]|uniref:transposase n=1 Tax=Azotobacter beijerinckii TaxID=170623 RepID=UPI00111370E9
MRSRIDWKYALGLELSDPCFHFSVLTEFRARLLNTQSEYLLLDKMLGHFRMRGLIKARLPAPGTTRSIPQRRTVWKNTATPRLIQHPPSSPCPR